MLIQIAFYILMLFSIAALVIDLGLLRLTQSQMQNASDPGAIEGLRWRDAAYDKTGNLIITGSVVPPGTILVRCDGSDGVTVNSPDVAGSLDENRRDMAACLTENAMDPNKGGLGEGPNVTLTDQSGGLGGDLMPLQFISASGL